MQGQFSHAGNASCLPCPWGMYSDTRLATVCKLCDAGSVQLLGPSCFECLGSLSASALSPHLSPPPLFLFSLPNSLFAAVAYWCFVYPGDSATPWVRTRASAKGPVYPVRSHHTSLHVRRCVFVAQVVRCLGCYCIAGSKNKNKVCCCCSRCCVHCAFFDHCLH